MNKDKGQVQNNLGVEPFELADRHFGSGTKPPKSAGTMRQDNQLENLADKLEKELSGKSFVETVDVADEKKDEKTQDILELEQEIENLQDNLLPKQDLKPEHELEKPEDLELAEKEMKKLEIKKLREEKREEERKLKEEKKREKEIEKQRNKEIKEEKKRAKELTGQMQPKLGFGWYVNVVKRPVVYLAGIEFLIYFFSLILIIKPFLLNIVLPLVFVLDIIVFGWLMARVLRKHRQGFWTGVKAVVLAGILVGMARAVFKVIWINEAWTMFNVLTEPIVTGGIAGIVGLVVGFIARKKQDIITEQASNYSAK